VPGDFGHAETLVEGADAVVDGEHVEDEVLALARGFAEECADELRAARLAQYSPLMSAAAIRETAVACTVVSQHCATRLDILSAAAGAPAELARAAFAARYAQ
jgi:hypothetical protein